MYINFNLHNIHKHVNILTCCCRHATFCGKALLAAKSSDVRQMVQPWLLLARLSAQKVA